MSCPIYMPLNRILDFSINYWRHMEFRFYYYYTLWKCVQDVDGIALLIHYSSLIKYLKKKNDITDGVRTRTSTRMIFRQYNLKRAVFFQFNFFLKKSNKWLILVIFNSLFWKVDYASNYISDSPFFTVRLLVRHIQLAHKITVETVRVCRFA